MEVKVVNNVEVTITGQISDDEISIYLDQLQDKIKFKIIKADVAVDGDHVDVQYEIEYVPFDRIRRITGYLVGTTERWNDAKKAELKDRVKHG